jgi:hypothetical protein
MHICYIVFHTVALSLKHYLRMFIPARRTSSTSSS